MQTKVVKVKKFETYLSEIFGLPAFRNQQREVIEAIVKKKRDVCCIMATGHGKSLCYQLPPIILGKPALVISPLLSLMEDQKVNMEKIGVKACCYSSSFGNLSKIGEEILAGHYQIIYVTPETAVTSQDFFQKLHKILGLSVIGVDESHCVSCWGHSFRQSYLELSCLKKWFPTVPIMALTGTATTQVESDIIDLLNLKNPLLVRTSSDRPNLSYSVQMKTNVLSDLKGLVVGDVSTIIYCQTRKETEKITDILQKVGIRCQAYHAGISNEIRKEIHHEFLNNEITCIIATVCFGMGINKSDIRQIIHYGCPKDIESYTQEIGRAGRDGLSSQCVIYFNQTDFGINRSFLKDITDPLLKKHAEKMNQVMETYLYTTECRRQYILNYFGESLQTKPNPCCDNCINYLIHSPVTVEIGPEAKLFLELVKCFSGKFGKSTLINTLRGANVKNMAQYLLSHEHYGKGQYRNQTWWKTCVQHLINSGLITESSYRGGFGSIISIDKPGLVWLDHNTDLENPSLTIQENIATLGCLSNQVPVTKQLDNCKGATGLRGVSHNQDLLTPTEKISYDFFHNDQKTITEIASIRNFTPQTICKHLSKSIELGLPVDLVKLGLSENKFNEIASVITQQLNSETSRLAPIKALCSHQTTYPEIMFTVALIKAKKCYQGADSLLTPVAPDQSPIG